MTSGGELDAVPRGPVPSSAGGDRLLDLVRVMARLRGPDGCPWDREQTHASLARHLLEETHETLEAIDAGDPERLRDELGDVLLQVVFHAQMAADDGVFDVDGVAEGIVRKLVRRHPHVFGDATVSGADEVLANWEKIKEEERGRARVDDAIPASLPALARAAKVQRRAADALREALGSLETAGDDAAAIEARLGDLLFAAVAVARAHGIDADQALRRTTADFADRFERERDAR
ncbi:MAG: nucleoside triphosphate pyrophosphohydrolase [Actinomycetota bacterium]